MEEIKKLYRIADQTRTIHSLLRDRLVLIENTILAYITIGSAVSAMLIFAPIQSQYDIVVGLFVASIFIISLLPCILSLKEKILGRTLAIQAWGKWIRDANNFHEQQPDTQVENELLEQYKAIMGKTLLIPDSIFNKYKQKHLQKIAISKALSVTPFKSIRKIKKELVNTDTS